MEIKVGWASTLFNYSDLVGYHSWRKLGDVASSLFALGYHERVDTSPPIPEFLADLRRAVFARAYSADKNVAIFLGRPPRIHRKYCRFRIPGYDAKSIQESRKSPLKPAYEWSGDEDFDYVADTRWSALCAHLKEDILDLFREENDEQRSEKIKLIALFSKTKPC